jgi:hypothetical protein
MVTSGNTESRRCPRCQAILDGETALCPYCGQATPSTSTPSPGRSRWRLLLVLLVVAVLAALGLRRLDRSSGEAGRCMGGESPVVEWRSPEPRREFAVSHLFQIEPIGIPYFKLADIRTTGNAVYGKKCDGEWGHIHDPVYFAVSREGGNAYFNNPATAFSGGNVEVVVTAVLAHAGPLPKAVKDLHFPEGRALMVVHVTPGTLAEAMGLHAGDLLARFNGVALSQGTIRQMEAIPIVADEAVDIELVREGRPLTLHTSRKGKDKLGYNYGEVPILEVVP